MCDVFRGGIPGAIALVLGVGVRWVVVLVVNVIVLVASGQFWWDVVPFWGNVTVGEDRGGVWEILIELLLITLGEVKLSALIVSIVLISRIMDVKLGVLFCLFAIL